MSDFQVLRDIYKTKKHCIGISASSIKNSTRDLQIWESKFGGIPYFPNGIEYPRNKEKKPLYLLAQINFIDMPRLEFFPLDGILQFYIDDDELYGVDFDSGGGEGFKVIYIPNIGIYDKQADLSFVNKSPNEFPISCPHGLQFYNSNLPIPSDHPFFEQVYSPYVKNDKFEGEDFIDLYSLLIEGANNHQIGGYISFIQGEPEFMLNTSEEYILLLKIGYEEEVCFGDAGSAYFFITKQDLENLDFSKVKYYWDCG